MSGEESIIGRSFVVHEKFDDLGQGFYEKSNVDGNVGARLGCGVIGRSKNNKWFKGFLSIIMLFKHYFVYIVLSIFKLL